MSSSSSPRFAWATLLTKSVYLPGLLVLLHGLRTTQSKYPLVVMVPPQLPQEAREVLVKVGAVLREVEYLKIEGGGHMDERFGEVWTKIRVWELLEYERVVLIDSDVVIRKNMDELFEIDLEPGHIAASHVCACNPRKLPYFPKDWIPSNCAHTYVPTPHSPPPDPTPGGTTPRPFTQLNSGVVLLKPSTQTFNDLLHTLQTKPDEVATYIFADQDLITSVFQGKWKALPWYYNALRTLEYVHPQLWDKDQVRCLHYILFDKPWHSRLMLQDKVFARTNTWWWETWDELVELLMETNSGVVEFVSQFVDFEKDWKP